MKPTIRNLGFCGFASFGYCFAMLHPIYHLLPDTKRHQEGAIVTFLLLFVLMPMWVLLTQCLLSFFLIADGVPLKKRVYYIALYSLVSPALFYLCLRFMPFQWTAFLIPTSR
jgi:hypothetical protein